MAAFVAVIFFAGMSFGANLANLDVTNLPVNVTAAQVEAILGGKLSGYGQAYVDAGQKYGVSPLLLAAVSMHETGGTNTNKNNVFGMMDPSTNYMTKQSYDSIAASINAGARNLSNNYIGSGLTTIGGIGGKYAPEGAANDPGGLNGYWANGVSTYLGKSADGGIQSILNDPSNYKLNEQTGVPNQNVNDPNAGGPGLNEDSLFNVDAPRVNEIILIYKILRNGLTGLSSEISKITPTITNLSLAGYAIAFVMLVYSLVKSIDGERSGHEVNRAIARSVTYAAVMAISGSVLIPAMNAGAESLGDFIRLGRAPENVMLSQFTKLTKILNFTGDSLSVFQFMEGLKAVALAIVFILIVCGDMIVVFGTLLKDLIVELSKMFIPVAVAMLSIGALSGIGRNMIMSTVAVMFWPVGWAIVGLLATLFASIGNSIAERISTVGWGLSGLFVLVIYGVIPLVVLILNLLSAKYISGLVQHGSDAIGGMLGSTAKMPASAASGASKIAAGVVIAKASGGASVAARAAASGAGGLGNRGGK